MEYNEASELLISNAVQKFAREIIAVKTGIDAVEGCWDNADIDLVFTDIKMPEM